MDANNKANNPAYSRNDPSAVNLTDEQCKKILPKNVYEVARQKGTERKSCADAVNPTWVTFSTTALLLRV